MSAPRRSVFGVGGSGLLLALLVGATPAWAGLTLSTDDRAVLFGLMQLGETKEALRLGSYHNELTCSSTGGRPWYLKVHVLRPLTSGAHTIPLEALTWQLDFTTGNGTVPHANTRVPFSLAPDTVYLSGPAEAAGQAVTFRFKYALTIPETQVSGAYSTVIRFTLTELL